MKNLVIFFLSLGAILICGSHSAYASAHNGKISFSLASNIEKNQQAQSTIARNNYILAQDISLNGEESNLVSVDDEDDNEDVIKKHISQGRYLLAFCYAFLSHHPFSFSADPLPVVLHLSFTSSCKYITQRTLRI